MITDIHSEERLAQATFVIHLRDVLGWTKNTSTQADVKVLILDTLYASLPRPPFTDEEAEALAERIYGFVWQQSEIAA